MDIELKEYLKEVNFDKQFDFLVKKLKGKDVVIYGCGQLFEYINKKYNLKLINIIGVCDLKFLNAGVTEFLGYKVLDLKEIEVLKPDYILVSMLNYTEIIKNFETKIRLKPLVKKSLIKVLKEIWCR